VDEELKRVEDMTEVELDAELRKYGVDPQQLEGKMLQKLFECVGEQAARIEALKADRVASTEAMRKALEAARDFIAVVECDEGLTTDNLLAQIDAALAARAAEPGTEEKDGKDSSRGA
jgi:hypothetical protein